MRGPDNSLKMHTYICNNFFQRKILDSSLGFAAGVMTAASFWSLLVPAIEVAESSGSYGSKGEWACIPVAVGFLAGALFVYAADVMMGSSDLLSISIAPSRILLDNFDFPFIITVLS